MSDLSTKLSLTLWQHFDDGSCEERLSYTDQGEALAHVVGMGFTPEEFYDRLTDLQTQPQSMLTNSDWTICFKLVN